MNIWNYCKRLGRSRLGSRIVPFVLSLLGVLLVGIPALATHPWALVPEDLEVYDLPQAVPAARVEQLQEQTDRVAPWRYDLQSYPVTEEHETHWRQTLWATAILEPQRQDVAEAIASILPLAWEPDITESQARTVHMAMQIGTQLYLSNPSLYQPLEERFWAIVRLSPQPQWAAMSLSVLTQNGLAADLVAGEIEILRDRFINVSSLILDMAFRDLQEQLTPASQPPIADLLNWQVAPKQAQIYVLCRPDRDVLCLGLLKDQKGQWVREKDGSLWQVPLLARSLHGLRWNYIRGATPQGIYRVEGTMPRSTTTYFRAFGQFPLVKMFMPYEEGVEDFVPGVETFLPAEEETLQGAVEDYQKLLPPSWRDYFPIEQAYWAGRRGRGLIRIHGSGEPPNFFSNNQRAPESYPWNPAIGCISAIELYDTKGRLVEADMPKILQAFSEAAGGKVEGYVVMVDVPGADTPVTLAELGL